MISAYAKSTMIQMFLELTLLLVVVRFSLSRVFYKIVN
jgi:hypothetical protein